MIQPGIHDSNAARSAVASRYIEQCSGLWVVAPITRAVDDRAAQTLLDTSFKRQLQFDGTYSRITVICSKADDLSVTEAVKVLPEGETAHQHHEHSILLEAEGKKVQEAITELKAKIAGNKMAQDCQFDAMDSLRAAIRRSGDDEDLLLLVSPGSARKRHTRTAASEARKRMKRANSFDADDSDSDQDEDSLTSETESDDEQKEQVSKEVAQKRLEDIEALNAVLRSECKELELRLKPLHKNLKEIKGEIKSLKSQAKRGCIRFRNEYARPEIQAQFAEGIRE
jgi:septal ring factor EnvC (AmiA/AmiB activator)